MKNLFFALLFVFTFAHATDFSLDKDECIILVASTKSETEAQALAKKYSGSELYTSKSGYIAIGLEKISKQQSAARIKELLSAGKIPKGSNCADGTRITGLLNVGVQTPEKQANKKENEDSKQTPKNTSPSLTSPQKNAVRQAKQYLSLKGFSRDGLIYQLGFNGFDEADSAIALDSMNIDWSEQAARSAKSYLDLIGFSCTGLIQQLTSVADKFSLDQARYGANKAGGC